MSLDTPELHRLLNQRRQLIENRNNITDMLLKLLDEIQCGGTLEPGVLSARLGTTPQMVRVMLEHLERLGKLQAFSACSAQGCDGCAISGMCAPKRDGGRVWQLKK